MVQYRPLFEDSVSRIGDATQAEARGAGNESWGETVRETEELPIM